jgi:hypothetical protein
MKYRCLTATVVLSLLTLPLFASVEAQTRCPSGAKVVNTFTERTWRVTQPGNSFGIAISIPTKLKLPGDTTTKTIILRGGIALLSTAKKAPGKAPFETLQLKLAHKGISKKTLTCTYKITAGAKTKYGTLRGLSSPSYITLSNAKP